jgi:hypothetical protein
MINHYPKQANNKGRYKMKRQFDMENDKERERLKKLVNSLTDEELKLVIYKEGWTIAAALGHLAFWDQWSLLLMTKWKKSGKVTFPSVDWDTFNDTLLPNDAIIPFLLAIPPRVAANMAISSAESIDRELEDTSPEIIAAIERLGDETRLFRSIHRKLHLDEIEAFLKTKCKK